MKINKKLCKCKRKVIILNYKWESFFLPKKIIRNDEIKRYKLSKLKPNIRERIVPSCLRHKCDRDCYKQQHFREVRQIKTKNKINRTKHTHSKKTRQEKLLHPEFRLEDRISSESLSSYEDTETLRINESNENWELLPHATSSYLNTNGMKGSINSSDTLIFGHHEDPIKCQTNTRTFHSTSKRGDIMNIETKNVISSISGIENNEAIFK